jgi:hypothetical protein
MIELGYNLRESPVQDHDLKEVDESTLHYNLFLGDVTFRVDEADMSALWGWIPIVDFAVCLDRIANELVPNKSQSFEFTESEDRIDFTLLDATVDIRTTYAAPQANVSAEELRQATRDFLRRVLDDLTAKYATLAQNAYIRRIYPKL